MKPAFITALGERRSSPSVVNSQLTPNANTTVSAERGDHAERAALGTEPEDERRASMITVPAMT